MSAPTALFVLREVLAHAPPGPLLASALGPGFTAGFLLLRPGPGDAMAGRGGPSP